MPDYCYTAAFAAQHDAQAAVRYVRKNAAALHADPNRIAMGGESAGGITSLLAGWRANDPGTSGNPGPSSAIRAAVPVAGGLPRNDFINAGDAPAMFFNGTADPTVPFSWATGNVLSMRAAGVLVDIMPFVGAGHSLIPQFGRTIVDQTSYFLWYTMDLAHAAR